MPLIRSIKGLFDTLAHKEGLDRDLDEELESTLDLLAGEKIDGGMEPDEARRQARLELGGTEQVKMQVREGRLGAALDSLLQDARYSFRSLGKQKGFTAIAVVILALSLIHI